MSLTYYLMKDVHLSYSDFNRMPWYEILMLVDDHNDFIDKQNDQKDEQNDVIAQQQSQMESMYRQQQNALPKFDQQQLPAPGNFKMPDFSFPK